MAVAELVEHVGAYNEKLLAGHFIPDAARVFVMDGVPVHSFFLEEAIVLVEYSPQGLEITPWVIGIFLYLMA